MKEIETKSDQAIDDLQASQLNKTIELPEDFTTMSQEIFSVPNTLIIATPEKSRQLVKILMRQTAEETPPRPCCLVNLPSLDDFDRLLVDVAIINDRREAAGMPAYLKRGFPIKFFPCPVNQRQFSKVFKAKRFPLTEIFQGGLCLVIQHMDVNPLVCQYLKEITIVKLMLNNCIFEREINNNRSVLTEEAKKELDFDIYQEKWLTLYFIGCKFNSSLRDINLERLLSVNPMIINQQVIDFLPLFPDAFFISCDFVEKINWSPAYANAKLYFDRSIRLY